MSKTIYEPSVKVAIAASTVTGQKKSWGIGARHREQLGTQKQHEAAAAAAMVSGTLGPFTGLLSLLPSRAIFHNLLFIFLTDCPHLASIDVQLSETASSEAASGHATLAPPVKGKWGPSAGYAPLWERNDRKQQTETHQPDALWIKATGEAVVQKGGFKPADFYILRCPSLSN